MTVVKNMSRSMDYLLAANFVQALTALVMGGIVWPLVGPYVFISGVAGLVYSAYVLFAVRGVK
jgi:hypothetical protein